MENQNTVNEPAVPYGQPLDFQQVWLMFQETARSFKETDLKFQETDRVLSEKFQETDLKFKETDLKFQETDRVLSEKFQETERLFKETDKKIRKLDQLFTSQWGKLVESLVKGDLIKLLKGRGIGVQRILHGVEGNYEGQNYEYDLIAINGDEIVIVEVKTTLRPDDIEHFHKKLWKAKTWMPEYQNKRIFGSVAYISVQGDSHRMAENLGFFVIRATGNSSTIINREGFQPKAF